MSGTHVYYNQVLFKDCETLEFSQVVEYDETQTYERFVKTRITVASTLVSIYQSGSSVPLPPADQHPSTIIIPPINGDETMVSRAEEIMQRLSEPRKDFWYAVNGVADGAGQGVQTPVPKESRTSGSSYRLVLIATGERLKVVSSSLTNEYVKMSDQDLSVKRVNVQDANNGPKPMGLYVEQVFGGNVLRVQATFEICRVLSKPVPDADNPDPGYDAQKARGVISNTWSVVDGLDSDGTVTHTVTGKLVVKDRRFKPNAMRLFAFPLAFPYARLVDRKHTIDESGLVLGYSYQFKHAGAAPPPGVRDYEAHYIERVRAGNAPLQSATMVIRVRGWHDRTITGLNNAGVPVDVAAALPDREKLQKAVLLRGAYTILRARIAGINKLWNPLPGGQPAKNVNLVSAEVIERVGLPQLELRVDVIYSAQEDVEFFNRMKLLGQAIDIPDYDPRWWPVDNEWGRLPALDSENPNFRATAFPYALSGDPTQSDYFTGYFQSPGNNRHTLPRITGITTNDAETIDSKEWARPGGSVPANATSAAGSSPATNSENPMVGPAFKAIPSKNLSGDTVLGPLPQATDASYSGISDVQKSGFIYTEWISELLHSSGTGIIMLPLSKPRDITPGTYVVPPQSPGDPAPTVIGKECSVPVRLHAPVTKRVYSVSTTRIGKWPQIPEPNNQIVQYKYVSSTGVVMHVETLLKKELITATPKLQADGCTREFTIDMRYTYGVSNPWAGSFEEGGGDDFATLPVGSDPTCKATGGDNQIIIKGDQNTLSPLFNKSAYWE